jgi:hypothetical protein
VCVSLGIYHSKWRLIIVFQGHLGQTNLPYILQQKAPGKWNSIINGVFNILEKRLIFYVFWMSFVNLTINFGLISFWCKIYVSLCSLTLHVNVWYVFILNILSQIKITIEIRHWSTFEDTSRESI